MADVQKKDQKWMLSVDTKKGISWSNRNRDKRVDICIEKVSFIEWQFIYRIL